MEILHLIIQMFVLTSGMHCCCSTLPPPSLLACMLWHLRKLSQSFCGWLKLNHMEPARRMLTYTVFMLNTLKPQARVKELLTVLSLDSRLQFEGRKMPTTPRFNYEKVIKTLASKSENFCCKSKTCKIPTVVVSKIIFATLLA